jgi:hypothetical protein
MLGCASSTLNRLMYFGSSLVACPLGSERSAVETYTRSLTTKESSSHQQWFAWCIWQTQLSMMVLCALARFCNACIMKCFTPGKESGDSVNPGFTLGI